MPYYTSHGLYGLYTYRPILQFSSLPHVTHYFYLAGKQNGTQEKSFCVKHLDVDIEKHISLVQQIPMFFNNTDVLDIIIMLHSIPES